MEPTTNYKDASRLTQLLKYMLILYAFIQIVAAWSSHAEYNLLKEIESGAYITESQAESNDNRQQMIGFIQMGYLVLTGIVFLKWIYRANYNARSLGATGLKFTPGWSVGYYFIPIVNLWRPYQAMKEIWKASLSPKVWEDAPVSEIVSFWWGLWIVSSLLGQASFRLSMRAENISQALNSSLLTLASDIIDIPLAIVAYFMVDKIYNMQKSHLGT